MTSAKMHPCEPDIDPTLVRDLVRHQFPKWARLPLTSVVSTGTDNAIYRLGDDMAVRLPRRPEAAEMIEKEARWLPRFAPHLPLAIPVPLAKGNPAHGYPWPWAICRWLVGRDALVEEVTDLNEAAIAVAHFISALRRIDSSGGPSPGPHNFFRGVPLEERDERTRAAIEALPHTFDKATLTLAWQRALEAPPWNREPQWIHGDLAAGNLLVRMNRIVGVLDWGGLAVADPACDLMIAWTLLSGRSRTAFREAVACDAATWNRAKGWTLSVAMIAIPYYLTTNPSIVQWATHAIQEVLGDSTA